MRRVCDYFSDLRTTKWRANADRRSFCAVMTTVIRASLLLLTMSGISVAEVAKDAPTADRVSVHDGRISVHVVDAPMARVITDVARQTGAEVKGTIPERTVSAAFDDATLQNGLQRILGDLSFALVFGDDGRLRTIELRGGPQERRKAAAAGGALATGPIPLGEGVQEATDTLRAFVTSDRPIPVRGRLARALGSNSVPFPTLVEAAVGQQDPRVRSDAVRAGLRAVESDREARDAFTLLLGNIGDDELAQVMRNMAKDRVLEFTNAIEREAHTDAVKARAHSMAGIVAEPARVN